MRARALVVAAAAALLPMLLLHAQADRTAGANGDWPTYNRDLAGTRYSPLARINTGNVARLVPAWSYRLDRTSAALSLTGGSELTPLVVDGVMYVTATGRVAALDGDSGREIWRYPTAGMTPSRRGLAYWPGDGTRPPRIVFTAGRRLVALTAASGEPAAEFGSAGIVDMAIPYESAPTVYNTLLIIGSNGAPGSVRAFDARTGAQVWQFRSVPEPGRPGSETWAGESWRDRGGVYSWAFSQTIDRARGMLYAVFEAPGPSDYWGADRLGDNLFSSSLVALDANTGSLKWHFQAVHHDLWDYDLPAPPVLLDAAINGATVPILAFAGKTGYMYILDRVTGKPVFGIEERPVPRSGVPGEQSAPTQPVPVKPPPIARVTFTPDDIVTPELTTAEHATFCRELYERSGGLANQGPFTPYPYRDAGEKPRSIVLFPGSIGGANWGGVASDPTLGYVFVNTNDEGSIGWVEKSPEGARVPYRRNSVVGPTSRFQWSEGEPQTGNIMGGQRGWPCQRPPWGNLVAVDVKTGAIAWKVPLGATDDLPEGKRNTGRLNMGGPIATAGGLVFIGATNDKRFRAFDSKTGRELWAAKLAMSAHAVPIAFEGRSGRQYVAIVAAGTSALDDPEPLGADALVVFALP